MCKRLREIKQAIRESGAIKEYVLVCKDPYTYVELNYNSVIGRGFAKRNPIDKPNIQLGYDIAYGRALHEIACALSGSSSGIVYNATPVSFTVIKGL